MSAKCFGGLMAAGAAVAWLCLAAALAEGSDRISTNPTLAVAFVLGVAFGLGVSIWTTATLDERGR